MPRTVDLTGLPLRLRKGGLAFLGGVTSRFPSGSPELDLLIGGGWPKDRVTYIQGDAGSGKSSLCAEAAYKFLLTGGDIVVFVALPGEHPLPGFSERVPGDQVFLLSDDVLSASDRIRTLLDSESISSALVVVDDIPSMVGSDKSGTTMSQFLYRVRPYLGRSLTLFLVNQTRSWGEAEYGASAYTTTMRGASLGLHVGTSFPIFSGKVRVGFRSTATCMHPHALCGKSTEFTVLYGEGLR